MPSEAVNEMTRSEWRELGFFYDRDDEVKEWRLVGSRAGLFRFRDLLLAYTEDPRNEMKSEHEHYGPYMYLEVMTWPEPGMDDNAIHGSLDDLRRLAAIVEEKLQNVKPGGTIRIQDEFAEDCEYSLTFLVREDEFDPASADPALQGGAG